MWNLKQCRASDPRDGWYTITPEAAAVMLQYAARNRPQKIKDIRRLSRAMIHRQFIANGETMVMACDGTLLDGQHRCLACVRCGVPFVTYVVFLPRTQDSTVMQTIDTGLVRTNADALAIYGASHVHLRAAVIRNVILAILSQHQDKGSGLVNSHIDITNRMVREFDELYRDRVNEAVQYASDMGKYANRTMSSSWLGCLVFLVGSAIKPFWTDSLAGTNLTVGSLKHTLHEWLMARGKEKKKLTPLHVRAVTLKAQNCFFEGRAPKTLKYAENELFPPIRGLIDTPLPWSDNKEDET